MSKVSERMSERTIVIELGVKEAEFLATVLAETVDWAKGAGSIGEELHTELTSFVSEFAYRADYNKTRDLFVVQREDEDIEEDEDLDDEDEYVDYDDDIDGDIYH